MKLSPTRMNMYLRCPKQFEFSYIHELKLPPVGVMVRGTACHEAVRHNYAVKKQTGEDAPLEDVLDAFSAAFDANIPEASLREDENPGKLKDSGAKLTRLYRIERAPTIVPEIYEERVILTLEGGDTFEGVVDLATPDRRIIDLKTASKKPGADQANNSLQLTAYGWSYFHLKGEMPTGYALDFAIHDHTAKTDRAEARLLTLETTRTATDLDDFAQDVAMVFAAIRAGAFPRHTDGWHCSHDWCGYWELCRGRG